MESGILRVVNNDVENVDVVKELRPQFSFINYKLENLDRLDLEWVQMELGKLQAKVIVLMREEK